MGGSGGEGGVETRALKHLVATGCGDEDVEPS